MSRIQNIISKNLSYLLTTILFLWIIRGYEFFFIEFIGEIQPKPSYFYSGLLFDMLISLALFGVSVILQYGLSFLRIQKQFILPFLAILVVSLTAGLVYYFKITKSPLDETIYSFTLEELKIISSGANDNIVTIVLLFSVLITIFFVVNHFLKKIKWKNTVAVSIGVLSIGCILFTPAAFYTSEKRTKEVFVNNRLVYFAGKSMEHFRNEGNNNLFVNSIEPGQFADLLKEVYPSNQTNADYPLMHIHKAKSELAPKFNKTKKGPPNIVFIIVESLCGDFVGEQAPKTGNCMPFLDSLSKKSLYFPHFLSTCQRTFNVLPASLTSVPNSTDGTFTTTNEFTHQMSLPLLLNKSHFTRFFCGVDLSYGNMNGYMANLNTRYMVEKWAEKYKKPFTTKSNFWGFPDGHLFHKSWDDYTSQKLQNKPRFDVFLTISTHEPYLFPKENEYIERAKKISRNKKMPDYVRRQLYKTPGLIASYMYTDDALRSYFEKARKAPDYENTIFIIYGDHGSPEYSRTAISRFHIPLIIYSPLLKKPETIEAINSQLDLAPSIVNYLKQEYNVKFPDELSFIGNEMDMSNQFSANRTMALLSLNGKNESFLHKNEIFLQDELYEVKKGFKLKKINSAKKSNFYKKQLKYYDLFSKYCFYNSRMIPEENYLSLLKTNAVKNNQYYVGDFKFWKHIYSTEKVRSKKHYIGFGEDIPMNTSVRRFRIICEIECFFRTEADFGKLPRLVSSLENTNPKGNKLVFWQHTIPVLMNKFKPNSINKIRYCLDINIREDRKISKNNILKYYFLNEDEDWMEYRKLKAIFYTVEKK